MVEFLDQKGPVPMISVESFLSLESKQLILPSYLLIYALLIRLLLSLFWDEKWTGFCFVLDSLRLKWLVGVRSELGLFLYVKFDSNSNAKLDECWGGFCWILWNSMCMCFAMVCALPWFVRSSVLIFVFNAMEILIKGACREWLWGV